MTLNNVGNSYGGATTVSAGVLQLGSATAIPSGAGYGDVTVNSPGTLDVHGQTASINGLWGTGTVNNLANTPASLTVGTNNVRPRSAATSPTATRHWAWSRRAMAPSS